MKKNYETPEIEVIDVRIEKGFAGSPTSNPLEDPNDDNSTTPW